MNSYWGSMLVQFNKIVLTFSPGPVCRLSKSWSQGIMLVWWLGHTKNNRTFSEILMSSTFWESERGVFRPKTGPNRNMKKNMISKMSLYGDLLMLISISMDEHQHRKALKLVYFKGDVCIYCPLKSKNGVTVACLAVDLTINLVF